jgi:small subunit ribosomal protein S17
VAEQKTPQESIAGRKTRLGVVTSDVRDKTITVRIDTARLQVHDETNTAGVGDTVRVMECRPLSATKRWRLVEIVERAR